MELGLVKTLLHELAMDDYVRFKYGKRIEAALKQVDQQAGVDVAEVEKQLLAALALVRKGSGAGAPAPKRRASKGKPDAPA